uniref:Uncharacterized protein n=1 Tax=Rhizophora mucronata TaxID=61149 RepID=A0A2P2N205_RHIMU
MPCFHICVSISHTNFRHTEGCFCSLHGLCQRLQQLLHKLP